MSTPGEMTPPRWTFDGRSLPVHAVNTLVVGSGAAARNTALQLLRNGVTDVALVTERWNAGTSFDAGSDKQTYYKVDLGGAADSAVELARDLWAGGSMHGDIALCEALGSARSFLNLVELGVPFPHDLHGGYPGYRTDNDTRGRATSAGPLTSRLMCEALGDELERRGLTIFDEHQVVALLTRSGRGAGPGPGGPDSGGPVVCGAVAIRRRGGEEDDFGLVVFNARNVILATGGPGGMYRDSVYPQSQRGSTGMALRAGAVAQSLTESQFGLASVGFRWNLSGSYQQVVPRYLSTDADGGNERDFLNRHFPDMATLASAIFRKGYEWPFDPARVAGYGSSLIDLLVHRERQKGRRVFLDFTSNPCGGDGLDPLTLDLLDPVARGYLQRSGALGETPASRLAAMNEPALRLFRDHGTDLTSQRLEIAVCAQHNNGGLRGDVWWETSLPHLFAVGEVCGTHGVRRPGGASLNSGQVGGVRAALRIAARYPDAPPALEDFARAVASQVEACLAFCRRSFGGPPSLTPAQVVGQVQERMTRTAAHIREPASVRAASVEAWALHDSLEDTLRVTDPRSVGSAFWAADLTLTHAVYLEAIVAYLEAGGRSRGSALVLDPAGTLPCPTVEEAWRFSVNEEGTRVDREILEVWLGPEGRVHTHWVPVRPVPDREDWFEAVWRQFREGRMEE